MNFLSHHIGSLLFEHRIDSGGELSCHRHNGFTRRPIARMALENRAVKLSKLRVLTDGRPGRLDQLAPQSSISGARDLTASNSLPAGVFAGSQADKARQLADVADLFRIADSSQKMAGHDLSNPRYAFQMRHHLAKLAVLFVEAADLFDRLKRLLLRVLQALQQPVKLKAHRSRAGKFFKLALDQKRPLTAGRSRRKFHPLEQQQPLDPKLHCHHVLHKGISKLGEVAQLAIGLRGNMHALQLPASQMRRELLTVEPVGLYSLTRYFRNHRRSRHHARVTFGRQLIIQAPSGGTCFIGKRDLLSPKMFAYVTQKMLCSVGHTERLQHPFMIHKGDRDALLIDIQTAEDIKLTRNKVLLFHPSASSVQRSISQPLYSSERTWSRA